MLAAISITWLRELLGGGEDVTPHRWPVQGRRAESPLPTPCPLLRGHQPSEGRLAGSHPLRGRFPFAPGVGLTSSFGAGGLMEAQPLPACSRPCPAGTASCRAVGRETGVGCCRFMQGFAKRWEIFLCVFSSSLLPKFVVCAMRTDPVLCHRTIES